MEIVLLLIAGVVVYFLYNTLQEYLKNPLHQSPQFNTTRTDNAPINFQNPYEELSQAQKAQSSEFGILAAIIGFVVWSDKKMCALEEQLLEDLLDDMAIESKNPKLTKEELKDIVTAQEKPSKPLEELCDEYVLLTKGEYKKRLKVVEFLFVIAYADGVLEADERECIIDIAALFEISNEDFNNLFEQFEKTYAKDVPMDLKRAKEIFGITHEMPTKEALNETYNELIKAKKQNIFDNKNSSKTFHDTSLEGIREIDKAYSLLIESAPSTAQKYDMQVPSLDAPPKTSEDKTRKHWDF